MAEVGFEMMIYSFGSGFKLESNNPAYIQKVANQIKYAHSKGIEVGGYDFIFLFFFYLFIFFFNKSNITKASISNDYNKIHLLPRSFDTILYF